MLGAVADNVDHVSAREEAWPLPTPESPASGRSCSAALVRPGTRAALSARTTRGVSEKRKPGHALTWLLCTAPTALLLYRSGGRGQRPARPGRPSRLVRCLRPDMTWPVAPGCLSRPTGLRRRGAPHPGSHSGGTPSFARATDLGLPKTLGRLGKDSVIGFPNPHDPSRPAVTTM